MSPSAKISLVGSILERNPSSSSVAPAPRANLDRGFPSVQHRSKSAFQRAREEKKKASTLGRHSNIPTVLPTSLSGNNVENDNDDFRSNGQVIADATEGWRRQMEEENQKKVEAMTEEELAAERKEILERFGPDVEDILRRARAAREFKSVIGDERPPRSPKVLKSAMASRAASPSPMSPASERPPSRTDRQLRFADVTTKDVHVYESQPPSPRKQPLALVSPSDADGPVVSLGEFRGKLTSSAADSTSPSSPMDVDATEKSREPVRNITEGTPEDIRRRYFPNVAPHDPSIAWMEDTDATQESPLPSGLRFDLSGNSISPSDAERLPTHLGLHHHAEGRHAGYTLDDIFLLSRSTVPAQRASMLDVLSKIARRLSDVARRQGTNIKELEGQEKALRKRMLAAGLETISERGTIGPRAVELAWVCVVFWDQDLVDVEGIELKVPSDDALSPLPLEDFVLPQIADALKAAVLPYESLLQLLDVLHRLARHSNNIASLIVKTPNLLTNIVKRFILVSPTSEEDTQPQPRAIDILIVLAQSSRQNATSVAEFTDPLLRFIASLPSSSIHPEPLALSLLTSTLRLYAALAQYGLYSQLASTAVEPLRALGQYILSSACVSNTLRESWLLLLEAWMVCARDPHKTTPEHDILWSQVSVWSWGEDILSLHRLLQANQTRVWAALWRAESAWLEGTTVNAPKHGEAEKEKTLQVLQPLFDGGVAATVVHTAVQELDAALVALSPSDLAQREAWNRLSSRADVIAATLRLWLSCLPSPNDASISAPPFTLPFAEISRLCARLATHPLWSSVHHEAPSIIRPSVRSLSLLLSAYLEFSRFLPGATDDLWLAQAFSIIGNLVPGDEGRAAGFLERVCSTINLGFMESRGWVVPAEIWDKRGLESVVPFLTFSLKHSPVRVGPLWPTPVSISASTTLRLSVSAPSSESAARQTSALPVNRDWTFSPLDYLLRSGHSEVFKSLPSSWDFSETEMVRATLLLAKVHREVLLMHGLSAFALNGTETVFSCMKVFMLEHEQHQETSVEEVFRDSIVGRFMEDLLAPFTVSPNSSAGPLPAVADASLEDISKPFLGAGTPLYQYYTDFVALYDAISFSHPLFARLLLPTLAMRYPADYRKYLWADFNHVVRTIRVPIEAVVARDVREFLWPVETNPEVLSAYLRALGRGHTEGFLHLIAVHHVACSIWPDLRENSGAEGDEKAAKLLQVVVSQASPAVIKDVVSYNQKREALVLPPACFEGIDEVKGTRKQFVEQCGPEVMSRLSALLD